MKQVLCCLLLLTAATATKACDACACASQGGNLGILPQYYRHFAGLQYQYSEYGNSHANNDGSTTASTQYYHAMQLWGRYYISRRIQLFGFVPYHYNVQNTGNTHTVIKGPGDVSLWANTTLLQTADTVCSPLKQLLLAGAGVKAPTGEYKGISQLDKEGLPNMQAGTGSWDFIVNTNYTLRKNNLGMNLEASYTFTTVTTDNYKYGNRLATGLLGFYSTQLRSVTLLPQAGFRYQYTLHDYDNYKLKWLNKQTGGQFLFAVAGLQAYYKRIGLQLNYSIPLAQNFAKGNVTAKQKADAGLFILF